MSLLSLSNVKKSFGATMLFSGISFTIEDNHKIGLVGVNGSGKTTLFKIIQDKLDYDSGEIIIDGKDLDTNLNEIKKKIGIVCQESKLDQSLSVYSNLINKAYLYGLKRKEAKAKVDEIIKIFDGVKDAEKALKVSHGWLSKAAKANKVAYGYRWKFVEEV